MEEQIFDKMRMQIANLKENLSKQEIISDKLIREVMKMKNKDIRYTKNTTYGAAVFCIIIYPLITLTHIWSWAFALATCIMMIFCIVATYYIHHPVDKLNYMTTDLATVARTMAKFKKQYNDWLRYVTPALLIPWLCWACYEFAWKNAPAGTNPIWMSIPLIVGTILGGLIGYLYHRKAVNAAQSILEQIQEEEEL